MNDDLLLALAKSNPEQVRALAEVRLTNLKLAEAKKRHDAAIEKAVREGCSLRTVARFANATAAQLSRRGYK